MSRSWDLGSDLSVDLSVSLSGSFASGQDPNKVYNADQYDTLLQGNGVLADDIGTLTPTIWAALGYANADAFWNDMYTNGILKSAIIAAIPSSTSPGTANLIAAYDFDDTSGIGQNDSSASGYNLTENGTSTWGLGAPTTYNGPTSADYLSSSVLSSNWASAAGDWTMVLRVKDISTNRGPYSGGGGREYLNWSSGGYYEGRIAASVAANLRITPTSSYSGAYVTLILQYDNTSGEASLFFLNENKTAIDTSGFTPSWSGAVSQIGASSGNGGTIDFMYFFDKIFTSDERKFFGDNSSIARTYGDL